MPVALAFFSGSSWPLGHGILSSLAGVGFSLRKPEVIRPVRLVAHVIGVGVALSSLSSLHMAFSSRVSIFLL